MLNNKFYQIKIKMQAIKISSEDKNKISKIKRNSEFSKTNRIRLDLFSFEKNEINEKKKQENDPFSFSSRIFDEKIETKKDELDKVEPKLINKQISLDSKKTSDDSFSSDMDDSDEESSEMSCVEEEEI